MNKQDLAANVKRIREDETLTYVIEGIQDDALAIFMNPNSEPERILEAHQSIQAVGILARAFDAIEADAAIDNDRES